MSLTLRNRQRVCVLNLRLLQRVVEWVIQGEFGAPHPEAARGRKVRRAGSERELGIYFVGAEEMARINADFLGHTGPTDVITFDYGKDGAEIFVCPDLAIKQARDFRTSWQAEIVRYVIHGILHLRGFDDLNVNGRRKMKRQENRLVGATLKEFSAAQIGKLR